MAQPHLYPFTIPPASTSVLRTPSHLDEGYSEDTRSQDADSEMLFTNEDPAVSNVLDGAMQLNEEQRMELIERLIGTLPNAQKDSVGKHCAKLTHFDPAQRLPNELMFSVLAYLSPRELLACGTVSPAWRARAQDEKLWRCCFAREGWLVDRGKLDRYEEAAKRKGAKYVEGVRKGKRPSLLERKGSRKRKPGEAFSDVEATRSESSGDELAVEPIASVLDNASDGSGDTSMDGVETFVGYLDGTIRHTTSASDTLTASGSSRRSSVSTTDSGTSLRRNPSVNNNRDDSSHDISPKLFRSGPPDDPKLSWPYLYKQRARLEKNWEKEGQHKMFSLPHPQHIDEGHQECVYTIQHTPRHLVSGSRDQTIRKWDLDTCRLIGEPLEGHEASVLCLQFDEREEHDIIVSGGSDSHVIIWRFSTGEIIKKITKAHNESVLNLRFDDRYIVTCSKDKSIKVWNRGEIPKDDPLVPTRKIELLAGIPDHLSDMPGSNIYPFSELATLHGHQAAVNAVMIHDNTIISASGDRTIKSWNIKETRLNKTYVGHTKGIACVQFDGRRIVSGSSDNTVRIFDAENQAEVACLAGHANLVRTVQARFGDLETVTDEELESQARKADKDFFAALENGMAPASASRGAPRNAGSARPEDMLALGTKIPPGGGGSKWAKIVSGSYDESVIIWKRDKDGRWIKKLVLKQDELLHAHFPREVRATRATLIPPPPNGAMQPLVQLSQTMHTQVHTQTQTQMHLPAAQAAAANLQHPQQPQHPPQPQQPAPNLQPLPPLQPHHHHHPHAANHHPAGHNRAHAESNRVFKLQFDTRRIICCSQNRVIVGWDFANGDPELERVGGWSLETA